MGETEYDVDAGAILVWRSCDGTIDAALLKLQQIEGAIQLRHILVTSDTQRTPIQHLFVGAVVRSFIHLAFAQSTLAQTSVSRASTSSSGTRSASVSSSRYRSGASSRCSGGRQREKDTLGGGGRVAEDENARGPRNRAW